MSPLVVTLACAGPGWQLCEELRERHFPPERNVVPAHIALFHHLPGSELDRICAEARAAAIPTFPVNITKARSLGKGVALVIEAPPLLALHQSLSRIWKSWLTPQDRAKFSPHVTIQNKVTSQEAKDLLSHVEATFTPFSCQATGLDIWYYQNGPWEHAAHLPFTSNLAVEADC